MLPVISIVVPFLNEEENLHEFCEAYDSYAAKKTFNIEVVFVDDGSNDGSCSVIVNYPFHNISVKLVRLSKNFGAHAAIRAGLCEITGDYAMLAFADMPEPLSFIEQLISEINKGYDILYTIRSGYKSTAFSKLYSRLMKQFAVREFPTGGTSNFFAARKVIDTFVLHPESNSSVFLQLLDMGYHQKFVECEYTDRAHGVSKWTLQKKMKLFIDSFVAFSYTPLRVISLGGMLLFTLGSLYALYIMVVKLFSLYPLDAGFPTLISVLLIGFGITNFSLGIISEYLWRTLDASRGRPVFIVSDVAVLHTATPRQSDSSSMNINER